MNVVDIGIGQLLLCLIFVAVAGMGSSLFKLMLGRDLAIGTLRTVAQLYLVGFVLKYVFAFDHPVPVVMFYVWMVFWAAQTIRSRVKEKAVSFFTHFFHHGDQLSGGEYSGHLDGDPGGAVVQTAVLHSNLWHDRRQRHERDHDCTGSIVQRAATTTG